MKYISTVIILLIFSVIIFAGIHRSTGIVGVTNKTNQGGCTCHSPTPDNTVNVQITGPDTLLMGETGDYQITLTGGPAVKGGFNVASFLGVLDPVDASAQLLLNELTHTSPKSFSGGSASWSFKMTAANQIYTDTIFSASNSVNGDGVNTSQDRWNFGQKFVVHVVDQPSSVDDERILLSDFTLNQNYPNPFNPGTTISWKSNLGSHQTLKVYDVTGKEIATLVDEYKSAGSYSVDFKMNNEFSSGIYFYKLTAGNFVETKKMLLIK